MRKKMKLRWHYTNDMKIFNVYNGNHRYGYLYVEYFKDGINRGMNKNFGIDIVRMNYVSEIGGQCDRRGPVAVSFEMLWDDVLDAAKAEGITDIEYCFNLILRQAEIYETGLRRVCRTRNDRRKLAQGLLSHSPEISC